MQQQPEDVEAHMSGDPDSAQRKAHLGELLAVETPELWFAALEDLGGEVVVVLPETLAQPSRPLCFSETARSVGHQLGQPACGVAVHSVRERAHRALVFSTEREDLMNEA